MTLPRSLNQPTNDAAQERANSLAEECRSAFEATIDYDGIAEQWAAELCDTHPELRKWESALCGRLQGFLERFVDTDAVAALGATLGVCLDEDAFQADWYANHREDERQREEYGDNGSGY